MFVISVFKVLWLVVILCESEAWSNQTEFSARAAELVRSVRLPEARLQTIPLVVQHLEIVLSTRWPGSRALVFGSTESGLALLQSDIDCFVLVPNDTAVDVEQAKNLLQQYPGIFAELTSYPNARIPILSFKHIQTGFKVDVNFKTIEGVQNTALIRYLIHQDERVLNLAVIVKYWAKVHRIIGRKRLPSYGIILLVIFYLQQKHILPPVSLLQTNAKPYFVENWNMGFDELLYESRNSETLYQLMGGFFEYYVQFDFDVNIVSTFVASPVKRRLFEDLNNVPSDFYLYRKNVALNITAPLNMSRSCIQDPFYHNKNVGNDLDSGEGSRFATQLKRAALKYRENNESVFLDEILYIY